MTSLRAKVIEDTSKHVHVVFVDRGTAKWWNDRRRPDDTVQFCGWYWVHGADEAGPFRTRSAAVRDAYYRFVLRRELPAIGHTLAYPGDVPQLRTRGRGRRRAG